VNGLEQLHKKNIFHGALKPANILISLADSTVTPVMELASLAFVSVSISRTPLPIWKEVLQSGWSRSWMPPEIYDCYSYTEAMDILSLGCLIGCTLSDGLHPFGPSEKKKQERFNRIANKELMLLTVQHLKFTLNPTQALTLIQAMMNPIPDERPPLAEVLSHPIFANPSTLLGKPCGKIHLFLSSL
jgi:serine/threonine protein kinase